MIIHPRHYCLLLKIYRYRLRCSSSIEAGEEDEEEEDDDVKEVDADKEDNAACVDSKAEVTGFCSRCPFLFLK